MRNGLPVGLLRGLRRAGPAGSKWDLNEIQEEPRWVTAWKQRGTRRGTGEVAVMAAILVLRRCNDTTRTYPLVLHRNQLRYRCT